MEKIYEIRLADNGMIMSIPSDGLLDVYEYEKSDNECMPNDYSKLSKALGSDIMDECLLGEEVNSEVSDMIDKLSNVDGLYCSGYRIKVSIDPIFEGNMK